MIKHKIVNLQPVKYNENKHFEFFSKLNVVTVTDKDRIVINGYELVCEDENESLEVGREVILTGSLYKRVFLEYKEDVQNYTFFKETEKKRIEQERLEKRKANSESFWKSYNIPFKYSLEFKERLSGFSEHSCGNGTVKNSTLHLYVHEDFKSGKLVRTQHSFLCSEQKTNANWSGSLGENDFVNDIYGIPNVVECKHCLKLMKRFKK